MGAEQNVLVQQYLIDIGRFGTLPKAEQIYLGWRFQRGDAAAGQRLILHNLKLVVSIARTFCNQGVAFLDLIQIGNVELFKALRKYNPAEGIKFSSYANQRVRRRLQKAVGSPGVIHVPDNALKAMREFHANGRAHRTNGQPARTQAAMRLAGLRAWSIVSLDMLIVGHDYLEGQECLGDFISGKANMPEAAIQSELMREALASALGELNPREQKIVRLLSVTKTKDGFGFAEVARRLSPPVSREWVRRIFKEQIRPKLLANPTFLQAYNLWRSPV